MGVQHPGQYFVEAPTATTGYAHRAIQRLQRRLQVAFATGKISAELRRGEQNCQVVFTFFSELDERFFRHWRHHVLKLMRRPGVSVTLRFVHLPEIQSEEWSAFLEQLSRYGDRVSIYWGEQVGTHSPPAPARLRVVSAR